MQNGNTITELAIMRFEKGHPDIGDKPFCWVYENRKKYLEFVRTWEVATGTYGLFQKYVELRDKLDGFSEISKDSNIQK